MKEIIIFLCMMLVFFCYVTVPVRAVEGLLAGVYLDYYEYDAQEGHYCHSIKVGEDSTYTYFAIVSTGDTGTENDGYIRTVKVEKATGGWTKSLIDYLEYDNSDGYQPFIINVGTGYYAICYCDAGASKQTVKTINVDSVGNVAAAVTDTQVLSNDGIDAASHCTATWVSGTVYAFAYTDVNGDGFIETLSISSSGVISDSVLDTEEFDEVDGLRPCIVRLDGDSVAVIYETTDTSTDGKDGMLMTYDIDGSGLISDSPVDSWEYATDIGTMPCIMSCSGDVYLIAYEGTGNDGFVQSLTITSSGDITTSFIDYIEFDTADGGYQTFFYIGESTHFASTLVYGICYQGGGGDGFVRTFYVTTSGSMAYTTATTSFEFDTTDNLWYGNVYEIANGYWAVIYVGTGNDGFVRTIMLDYCEESGEQYELYLYDNIINATGTHEYNINETGYQVWANYTGNTTAIHLSDVENNATGLLDYLLNDTGYWVSSIHESTITDYEDLVDCTGSTEYQWNGTTWLVWANYTGTGGGSLELYLFENIVNATGTHEYTQNATGYLVYANYTGNATGGKPIDLPIPFLTITMSMIFGVMGGILITTTTRKTKKV
jgi:hypothetical protein